MTPSPSLSEAAPPTKQAASPPRSLRKLILGIVRYVGLPGLLLGLIYFFGLPWWEGRNEMKSARAAIEEAEFSRAQRHLERYVELWPKDSEGHFLLARTTRRAGEFESARIHLQRSEELGWPPEQIKLERLLANAQAGAPQPVEMVLRGYMAQLPDDSAYICEASIIGYLQGNFLDDAYRWSTSWIKNVRDDGHALYWRGRVLEAGVQPDLAIEDYEGAILYGHAPQDARLRLAELLLRRLRFEEALSQFETFLQSNDDHPAALLGVAQCRRALNQPDQARSTLARLLTIQGDHAGALLLRGQLELDEDNAQEALPWLSRAQTMAPYDPDANQFLATALRRLNQVDQAEKYETRKAHIVKDLKRLEQLTKEIIDQPNNSQSRYEAGLINQKLGRDQQAARLLVSALLVDPSNQDIRRALAESLPSLGDNRLTELYQHLIKYSPPTHGADSGTR
jgi:tetratricopeptide (TPR) repeat protein